MRVVLASKALDNAEGLVAELKAIEQWDAAYWRNPRPEEYETLAYVARGKRRCEILSRLLSTKSSYRATRSEEPVHRQELGSHVRTEKRCHPRLELEAELIVRSQSGLVPGRTLDISESGLSAILAVQLYVGATVELEVKLPMAVATTRAVVRNHNVFRHGFEFLQPLHEVLGHEVASDDCRSCGGTGFILQAVAGGQGVTVTRIPCPGCEGVGRAKPAT